MKMKMTKSYIATESTALVRSGESDSLLFICVSPFIQRIFHFDSIPT